MQIRRILDLLEQVAPLDVAEPWDNVGLQVGDGDGEANGCLVALDAGPDTVREAKQCGVNLIITHHPVIFSPLQSVTGDAPEGRTVLAAARAGVAIYTAHTNLDASLQIGTGVALADRLGLARGPALLTTTAGGPQKATVAVVGEPQALGALLSQMGEQAPDWWHWPVTLADGEGQSALRGEITLPVSWARRLASTARQRGMEALVQQHVAAQSPYGLGMVTHVPQMTLSALGEYVARRLALPRVALVGPGERLVRRAALAPGAGGSMIDAAARVADVMITGEIKYHEAQNAQAMGLDVVMAGHYDTERPVLDIVAGYLRDAVEEQLTFAVSQMRTDPLRPWPQ